jgi:hypothetical protein
LGLNESEDGMKITTVISGQDAQRLADCISYASKHGLDVTEYTQCGVNSNSGNVWLWDENWTGCVYCTIGFDVSYMWSCPNCGDEQDVEIGSTFKPDCCDEIKEEYPDGIEV